MTNIHIKHPEIADLPSYLVEGYYWLSDATEPIILLNESIDIKIFQTQLPFVVEANFYTPKEDVSISIKNIDGNYHVNLIELANIDDPLKVVYSYKGIFSALSDSEEKQQWNFKVCEIWGEMSDEMLAGMKTLVPVCLAFIGFEPNKKDN